MSGTPTPQMDRQLEAVDRQIQSLRLSRDAVEVGEGDACPEGAAPPVAASGVLVAAGSVLATDGDDPCPPEDEASEPVEDATGHDAVVAAPDPAMTEPTPSPTASREPNISPSERAMRTRVAEVLGDFAPDDLDRLFDAMTLEERNDLFYSISSVRAG